MSELVYVVPFLTAIALLLVLGLGRQRHAPTADWSQDPFPTIGAYHIARFYRTRVIVAGVIILALVVYGWASDDFVDMMKFSGIVFLIDAGLAATSWRTATRALTLLRRDGASCMIDDDVLVIRHGEDTCTLGATPWLLARARRHALPKATL